MTGLFTDLIRSNAPVKILALSSELALDSPLTRAEPDSLVPLAHADSVFEQLLQK